MRLFGPAHTPESVAADLIRGLEDGSVTLGTAPGDGVSREDIARILTEMADALAELPRPTAEAVLRDLYARVRGALGPRDATAGPELLRQSDALLNP